MDINETASWLRERDNFLIITHRRPDGDTIGCAGALAQGLRDAGKSAYVLYNPEATARYLPFVEKYWAPESYKPGHVVTVDTASNDLFPVNGNGFVGSVSHCIDHHPSNRFYADRTCLDDTRASCGEIVYDILIALSGSISRDTAACLYVALSTDTGCFAFGNTTANTLRVAALTIEAGAPNRELNRALFRTKSKGRIMVEGMINSGLEFFFGGLVAIASVTKAMEKAANTDEDDMDDIASIPGSVEGVLVGITIRELSGPRDCKVSVRTSSLVNANDICVRFGGGGHAMAAGFSSESSIAEIKERLLAALGEFLPPV